MAKPKIIFIFGNGHSGSTLLDLTLGSSENAVSIGELRHWNKYLRSDSENNMKDQVYNYCTCGSKINECPLWSKIPAKETLNLDNKNNKKGVYQPRLNLFKYYLGLKDLADIDIDNSDYLYVYQQIQNQIGEDKWIVDSSKVPHNLIRVLKLWNEDKIDLKILGIRKHCSGVIYSKSKNAKFAWISPFFVWIFNYTIAYKSIRKSEVPNIFVSYEKFASSPYEEVNKISNFVGFNIPLKFDNKEFHNIGGNIMRFKKLDNIYLDEKWKTNLGFFKKNLGKIVNKIVLKINKNDGKKG